MFNLATPTFGNSPQPQVQQLRRESSTTVAATASSNHTPPALEQMTGVFSLSDAAQPKQRLRRKMTEAEKVEYRKRRIVKACEKCSKRKRKCHHNQPEMEVVGPTNSQKVTKPNAPAAPKKAPTVATPPLTQEQSAVLGANVMNFGDSFDSEISAQQLADYSTVLDDPLPDMTLDDFLAPQPQWPWSDTPDWTLMDFNMDNFATTDSTQPNRVKQENEQGPSHDQHGSFNEHLYGSNDLIDPTLLYPSSGEDWSTGEMERPRQRQQATHNIHVHDAEGPNMFVLDGETKAVSNSPRISWNNQGRESTSLSQMTLKLTGTVKAVKAFGNLLQSNPSRRSRLRSTSVGKIAVIALGGLSMAQRSTTAAGAHGRLLGCNYPCDSCHARFDMSSEWRKHQRVYDIHINGYQSQACQNALLEGMSTADYLRMKTNRSPVQEDGRATIPSIQSGQMLRAEPGAAKRGVMSTSLSKDPVLGSSGDQVLQTSNSTAQEGRQAPSLGEGLTSRQSPSTELFMLKRRIPKALHSIVDQNSQRTVLGPLQSTIHENVNTQTQRDREREMVISRNTERTGANATSRDGGAYQTVEADPTLAGGLPALENVFTPVRTLSRNPTYPGSSDITDGRYVAPTREAPTPELDNNFHVQAHTAQSTALTTDVHYTFSDVGSTPSKTRAPWNTQEGLAQQSEVYFERLSDHMRRRDHFGRPLCQSKALQSIFSLVALAALLVMLSFVPTQTISLSMVLLALASRVPTAKGERSLQNKQCSSQFGSMFLQRPTKDCQWLANAGNTACDYIPRLLYRGCRQDTRINGTLWRKGAGKQDGTCAGA